MEEKFTVDFNKVAQALPQRKTYRLADVQDRIEKVAYDLVRFRDNQDTDQLWKIENHPDGPVIVALYNDDDGSLVSESQSDWDAVPDKKAMHFYYKGEPLMSLSSAQLGIPEDEFGIARRWLPRKLSADKGLQEVLLKTASVPVRKLIAQCFPELEEVANVPESSGDWEDDGDDYMDNMVNKDIETIKDPNSSFDEFFRAFKSNYHPDSGQSNISGSVLKEGLISHKFSTDELKQIRDFMDFARNREIGGIV